VLTRRSTLLTLWRIPDTRARSIQKAKVLGEDGPKALDETQSQDWRIYGSEESREVQIGSSGKERQIACMMPPVITSKKPELRSKGLDRRQCCWHVSYRFCGLSAEITVYAENEAETRAKAVDQLRLRGLKVVA
jgi:hypothetical protein